MRERCTGPPPTGSPPTAGRRTTLSYRNITGHPVTISLDLRIARARAGSTASYTLTVSARKAS